jgi:hypothetical protein
MRIMVFMEGTILFHRAALNQTREAIVQQVKDKDPSTADFASYLPIGEAQKKLSLWRKQGHQIQYLTSRKKPNEIETIKEILTKYGFPEGLFFHRSSNEEYHEVVEKNIPDVLIEDDCESIGGVRARAPQNKIRYNEKNNTSCCKGIWWNRSSIR